MEILSRHHFEEAIKQSSNLLCSVFVGSEYDVNEFFMNYLCQRSDVPALQVRN